MFARDGKLAVVTGIAGCAFTAKVREVVEVDACSVVITRVEFLATFSAWDGDVAEEAGVSGWTVTGEHRKVIRVVTSSTVHARLARARNMCLASKSSMSLRAFTSEPTEIVTVQASTLILTGVTVDLARNLDLASVAGVRGKTRASVAEVVLGNDTLGISSTWVAVDGTRILNFAEVASVGSAIGTVTDETALVLGSNTLTVDTWVGTTSQLNIAVHTGESLVAHTTVFGKVRRVHAGTVVTARIGIARDVELASLANLSVRAAALKVGIAASSGGARDFGTGGSAFTRVGVAWCWHRWWGAGNQTVTCTVVHELWKVAAFTFVVPVESFWAVRKLTGCGASGGQTVCVRVVVSVFVTGTMVPEW